MELHEQILAQAIAEDVIPKLRTDSERLVEMKCCCKSMTLLPTILWTIRNAFSELNRSCAPWMNLESAAVAVTIFEHHSCRSGFRGGGFCSRLTLFQKLRIIQ